MRPGWTAPWTPCGQGCFDEFCQIFLFLRDVGLRRVFVFPFTKNKIDEHFVRVKIFLAFPLSICYFSSHFNTNSARNHSSSGDLKNSLLEINAAPLPTSSSNNNFMTFADCCCWTG
uniref:(northern house mosquito) hypothetical protein n=1 Tax=Culex pipiens TaxID=7175 RepID=A0A8D8BEK0_CULPI